LASLIRGISATCESTRRVPPSGWPFRSFTWSSRRQTGRYLSLSTVDWLTSRLSSGVRVMRPGMASAGVRWCVVFQVVKYFAYHAVPSNLGSLVAFHHHVTGLWRRTLQRSSQKDRTRWSDMTRLVSQWLPQPRIQHPWPNQRFAVKYPRWKPYAGKPHVRLCAGGA
jgi:hypothetical protein